MRRFDFKEGAFYDFYPQVEIKFCNSLGAHLNQIISGFRSTDLSSIKEKHILPIVKFFSDLKKTVVFLTALFLKHECFLYLDVNHICIGLEFMAMLKQDVNIY